MDQTIRLARLDRSGATATVIGDGVAARTRAELVGPAAAAALAVGLCDRALRMTVDYSKERVQFGRPIGSFQALKHRMADMLARLEIGRSASWAASYALATDATDAEELTRTAASYCLEAAAHLAGECVQLHGGIADHLGARRPPGVQARARAGPALRCPPPAPGRRHALTASVRLCQHGGIDLGGGGDMARSIWTGSVSFGLVNVPVRLYSATQDHKVHFHQFEKGTSNRIRNERVNEKTGDEVAYDDIVKGAEVDDGKYVDAHPGGAGVGRARPQLHHRHQRLRRGRGDRPDLLPEVLLPRAGRRHREEAVRAAGKAMEKSERIGVATFVMRGKQYLAAIRPSDGVLVLETMHFADEVRDPAKELDNLPKQTKVAPKDLKMAVSLVESLTTKWDPKNYKDTYQDRVKKLINAKKNDREIIREDTPEETSEKVIDLVAALQASVDGEGPKAGNADRAVKLRTRSRASENKAKPSKQVLYDSPRS